MNVPSRPAGASPPAPSLPHEPASPAELLSASHAFVVEVLGLAATDWSGGADGLEERTLTLRLRLAEVLKGELSAAPSEEFTAAVEQRRENAWLLGERDSFWAHVETGQGARYLVVSVLAGTSPAEAMREPAIRQLLPEQAAIEVRAATSAEQHFGEALRGGGEPARRAAARLLSDVYGVRDRLGGLFARYLWARVRPSFAAGGEGELLPLVLRLVEADDARLDLRHSLIYDLYTTSLDLEPDPERSVRLLAPLLRLLLQPQAAPLRDWLVQVPLYNLALTPDGAPRLAAGDVVPDAGERERMAEAAARVPAEKARLLAAWLRGGVGQER